jgi:hypothetical protein
MMGCALRAVPCCAVQVVEAALGLLPFSEKTITTPTGAYSGVPAAGARRGEFV